MYWMLLPLKRYADFSGRSRRKEYWMFALAQFLVQVVLLTPILFYVSAHGVQNSVDVSYAFKALLLLFALVCVGCIIPNMAVTVRRFHDVGKSGWLFLLNFIPYIGVLAVLIFMCVEGNAGDNAYGADPKQIKAP